MDSIASIVLLIVSGVIAIAFFMIVSAVNTISSTVKEMQAEQLKIYKALYLIAQSQGIGNKATKAEI